jgi:hypothetical protein
MTAAAVLRPLGADGGDPIGERNLEALRRLRRVVESGQRAALDSRTHGSLDRAGIRLLGRRDERERVAHRIGAGGTPHGGGCSPPARSARRSSRRGSAR